jgi:glutathione S-transferase
MTPTITAFKKSPDGGRGLARDMRVRWAFEEVGQAYEVKLVPWEKFKAPEHLARQPFGQIPTYEDGGLILFETGAIVLHIAETHPGTLLPDDPDARARAITWMFSAVTTLEQPIVEREAFILLEKDKPWFEARRPIVDDKVRNRLAQLSARLGEAEWLDGEFTAGDLMMVEVLKRPASISLLPDYPTLAAYVARGEARPAFGRAFQAQAEVFRAAQS